MIIAACFDSVERIKSNRLRLFGLIDQSFFVQSITQPEGYVMSIVEAALPPS